MKYGILGGFIKIAFAKTAFDYIGREIPEINMPSYKKRALKEYRAIVERTSGIGKMKDNMFVMTMYCGAFLIALYKEADGKITEEKLKGLIRAPIPNKNTARVFFYLEQVKGIISAINRYDCLRPNSLKTLIIYLNNSWKRLNCFTNGNFLRKSNTILK